METLDTVWKEFGKHSVAGKLLYDLYGVKYKPHVNYPTLKVKTKDEKKNEKEEELNKKRAKSSNKIYKIQYPDMNKKKFLNFAKVDLIPKRRKEKEIKKQIEIMKNNIEPPKNNPNNRKAQIGKNYIEIKRIYSKNSSFLQTQTYPRQQDCLPLKILILNLWKNRTKMHLRMIKRLNCSICMIL